MLDEAQCCTSNLISGAAGHGWTTAGTRPCRLEAALPEPRDVVDQGRLAAELAKAGIHLAAGIRAVARDLKQRLAKRGRRRLLSRLLHETPCPWYGRRSA